MDELKVPVGETCVIDGALMRHLGNGVFVPVSQEPLFKRFGEGESLHPESQSLGRLGGS